MPVEAILNGAPTWVYFLLAVLIALGVRRLKTREVPIIVAVIPVIAFFTWSVFGVVSFAAFAQIQTAIFAWCGGVAIGALSAVILPDTPPVRLSGGRVRLPATWAPLILYLTVFVSRFACGVWAAMNAEQAITATAVGVAIGAALTARLAVSVFQWRPAVNSAAG